MYFNIKGKAPCGELLSTKTTSRDALGAPGLWKESGRKLLRVMKMTVFLMIVACLHVAAKGVSQVVSIKAKDVPLERVFKEMSRQTGISILYNAEELWQAKPVSLDVKNVPLKQVLENVLKERGLEYNIQHDIIFIAQKETPRPEVKPVVAAPVKDSTIDIFGVVLSDATQKPIDGATVIIKGTQSGWVTSDGGLYQLKNVSKNTILIVSCMGYVSQEVQIDLEKGSRSGGANIIKLKPHVSQLDETVIQAYGTTTKRKITGNIITVKGEDIAKQPTLSPLLALQGKVAGLEITQQNGSEFGAVKVEIRGRKPINPNFTSDPLYIIDGVPLTVLETNAKPITPSNGSSGNAISRGFDQSGISNSFGVNPLSAINPADIASVEVLKDADATAIYGSRGANGVIIITTKKGRAGANRFNVSVNQGISFITGHWDMLNTQQYLAMRREAFKNDGIVPTLAPGTPGYAPDLLSFDTTRYTDWQKYFFNNQGKVTNVQADMSGGSEDITYRVGSGYSRSTDITTVRGASQRASVSLSLSAKSRNQKFRTYVSASYSSSDINAVAGFTLPLLPPDAPSIYDSAGKINFLQFKQIGVNLGNLANKYNVSHTNSDFLTGSINLGYQIVKGLEIRTTLGYNKNHLEGKTTTPIASKDPSNAQKGSATFGGSNTANWQIEPQMEYNSPTGRKGKLNVLVGGTIQAVATKSQTLIGLDYASDALLGSISNAPKIQAYDASAQYKYAGAFGRIGYTWKDKYIMNLNGRRDGSSRFGAGRQFGNFGSVGAAWIVSDEPWVRRNLPAFVSFVKLRGSYGVTGSDQIGDYQYLTQWGVRGDAPISFPYAGVSPLIPQIQANADFHWQATRKIEGAFNTAFLDDRISLEWAWYRERCNNQLIGYPTPVITGFTTVVKNSPASVQNSGWEFIVNARAIDHTDFSWTVNFNYSVNKNVLLDFPFLEQSPYLSVYKIGQPLTVRYLYRYTGINPQTGRFSFFDPNHDGVVQTDLTTSPGTGKDDRIVAVNFAPAFQGGFNNTFRWKTLSLSLDFSFTKRKAQQTSFNESPGKSENMSLWGYEHRWRYPGQTDALAPKLSTITRYDDFGSSDGEYVDASYLRFRTVALSYSLPAKIARTLHVASFTANLSAQNIFVLTGYRGIDPEVSQFGATPLARTITAGITCGF